MAKYEGSSETATVKQTMMSLKEGHVECSEV
jgi:hypothetical protein